MIALVGLLVGGCSGQRAPTDVDGPIDTDADADVDTDTDTDTDADVDTDVDTDSDTDTTIGDGPDFRPRIATIRITDNPPGLSGMLYEGVLPWDYAVVDEQGPCRALSLGIPQCDPECLGASICVAEDQCEPYPSLLSAGDLSVSGLDGVTLVTAAEPPVYWAAAPTLPGPDDVVAIEAGGDEIGAFSVQTAGVAPLVLDGGVPDRAPGEDLVLRWTPDPGSRIRARFAVDYAHRLAPEVVECEGPDTGELVVPAAMIDLVMGSEHWSCGSCFGQRLERYRGVRADVAPVPVDVEVVSAVSLPPTL